MATKPAPRILIIAGSDSGGGAGVQADIKTCAAFGVYAATAVTAVTVQNTRGVFAVHPIPAPVVAEQIRAVLDDIGADAVKIGMLGSAAVGQAALTALAGFGGPVVLDPVLVATSGDALGDGETAAFLRDRLIPRASLVTPNLPELAALTGAPAQTPEQIEAAARQLIDAGAGAVLAKGGHASGDTLTDRLVTSGGTIAIDHPRQDTRHTHGTGCTLASAIAAGLAQGVPLEAAVRRACAYVAAAIRHAPGLGSGLGGGHGPLEHAIQDGPDGWKPVATVT